MRSKQCIIRAHEFAVDGHRVPGGDADGALEFPPFMVSIHSNFRSLSLSSHLQLLRYARSCFYAELA